jgi:dihydrodipicolinate synthase/N-acetylneuraminate lyase
MKELEMLGEPLFYAIAPTPFRPGTDTIDPDAYSASLERLQRRHGVSHFLVGGAYGEFTSLTWHERVTLVATARSDGRRTIMGCAAEPSTTRTIELARELRDAGADLVMITPPLATEVGEDDIRRHFDRIADALGGHLVVYNNPVFGVDLAPELLARLFAHPAYVGIKQGSTSLPGFLASIEAARAAPLDRPWLLGASDLTAPATLAAGADGLSSTNCWVFPELVLGTVRAVAEGDIVLARALHRCWSQYRAFARRHGQPATVKAAMVLRGYTGAAAVRLPYQELEPAAREELREVIGACDSAAEPIRQQPEDA